MQTDITCSDEVDTQLTAWAKKLPRDDCQPERWLNLVDHSVDVAAVGAELLRLPTISEPLSELAKRPLSDIDIDRLCFFIGLHDAGKVTQDFQAKLCSYDKKPDADHIRPLWSIVGTRNHVNKCDRTLCSKLRKSLASARWQSWFDDWKTERALWLAILNHHNDPPDNLKPLPVEPRLWAPRDIYDPLVALEALAKAMINMFPSAFAPSHPDQLPTGCAHDFWQGFARLVRQSDQIGSDADVFGFPPDAKSGADRFPCSREQAANKMATSTTAQCIDYLVRAMATRKGTYEPAGSVAVRRRARGGRQWRPR